MADVVAVTGASGRLGGRVARRLATLGVPTRLVGPYPGGAAGAGRRGGDPAGVVR